MKDPQSSYRCAKANVSGLNVALPFLFSSIDCCKRGGKSQQPKAPAEHSSEKSCQDGASTRGESAKLDMSGTQSGGMSSHGSIGAVGEGSSQPQEVQGCRVSNSTNFSSESLGLTSINTPSEVEDADVSSAPLHGSKRGSLQECDAAGADGCSGAPELPDVAGETAQEKADNARAMAHAAMADARAKARCAAELMAAAQQKSVLESRSLKRKRTLGLKSYVGPPSHVLLGVRISVFWPDDHAFYKGRIVEVLDEDDRVMVKYDDEMDEALQLLNERFQWLAPRAQTAGANSELQMEMARLGAEGVAETPQVPDTSGMSMVRAPAGEAAVGGRVSVHFAGVGIWCRGEVLAYDATLEKHQILYEDGEHEWTRLSREAHTWWPACPDTPYPAGLPPGTSAPSCQEAIGWRVSIYWPDNNTFYDGKVIGYDNVTARHHVLYDSGDQEHVTLGTAKTCWVMPPSVSSQATGSEEASQLSAPKGSALGMDIAISSRTLRRSGSSGQAAAASRQAALLREHAPHRCGDALVAKAWLKEDLGGQGDGELLPFDEGMLEEGLCAEDFPQGVVAGNQLKADAPAWWHQQPHSHSAAMLISGLGPRPARSNQLPPFAEEDDVAVWSPAPLPAAAKAPRGGQLRSQRSLPDTSAPGLIGPRGVGGPALMRANTMPPMGDCQLDELISQLDAGAETMSMASPLSAGLEPMDMQLPGLDLGSACVPSLLLDQPADPQQGSSLVASSSAPLIGGSAHGSVEFQSHLSGAARDFLGSASPPDVADVAQFLCGDDEDAKQLIVETSGSLGSTRGSVRSFVSDSTVVHLGLPSSQPAPLPGSPRICTASATATPESARRTLNWDLVRKQQGLALEEPLQAPTGSAALISMPMAPEALEPSVDLSAGATDGLAMANELQTLLAEMDWG